MFKLKQGKTETIYLPRPASTEFEDGDLLAFNGSGQVAPADSADTEYVGVMVGDVTSADDDYATADVLIPVEIPVENYVRWEADTANAVADDIGNQVDLTDSQTVNRGATAVGAILVTGYESGSKLEVVIQTGF